MAKLIMDYYCGKDLYSDGDIESRILEYVQKQRDLSDLDIYADKDEYYAFLYHLSNIRENILSWYPFKEDCKILEIGSGCGAITGMLCKKAEKVTSVELSKARAEINYLRNKNVDNLEIIVGNLNDLVIDQDFDYVILNGVLEYACSFTKGRNPFNTFLCNISSYLKPKGKLLLAIENRLGIKYFAGALEDHTDKCFWGIKQYPKDDTVRTFSKLELEELLEGAGFNYNRFYYPYPDYKFPNEIYTDDNINAGDYGNHSIYFDKTTKRLFDENLVIDSLKEEKVLDKFANSFLVEAAVQKLDKEHIIFAKLNTVRKKEFSIGTIIKKTKWKKKIVMKYALNSYAVNHVYKIYKNSNMKLPSGCYNVKGKYTKGVVEYPFIYGHTLSKRVANLSRKGYLNEIIALVKDISERILGIGEMRKNIYSTEFIQLFGNNRIDKNFECIWNPNIDLIFDNIIYTRKGYFILDCEWCIEAWVPKKFIIWRIVNELFNQNSYLKQLIEFPSLLKEFAIEEDENICFREWANHFADIYVLEKKISKYNKINNEVDITDIIRGIVKLSTSLYINTGKGFSEEEKIWQDIILNEDGKFEVVFDLEGWENIESLRWDPLEGELIKCENIRITIDDEDVLFKSYNSELFNQNIFFNIDPQYICVDIKSGSRILKINGNILRFLEADKLIRVYQTDIRPQILMDLEGKS